MNTILDGNFGTTNIYGTNDIVADDINGLGLSLGHNLIGTAIGFTNLAPTDLLGADPRLGPLQDNGGGTLTHALLAGSPAIDAGAPTGVPFDQQGQPRTVDDPAIPNAKGSDGTDIGAFEANPILSMTGLALVGEDLHVSFTTVSTGTYRVQYKPHLSDSTWTILSGVMSGTGGIVTVTNLGAGLLPAGFYRIYRQ